MFQYSLAERTVPVSVPGKRFRRFRFRVRSPEPQNSRSDNFFLSDTVWQTEISMVELGQWLSD